MFSMVIRTRKRPDRCQVKTHRVLSNGYSEGLWKRVEIRNRGGDKANDGGDKCSCYKYACDDSMAMWGP